MKLCLFFFPILLTVIALPGCSEKEKPTIGVTPSSLVFTAEEGTNPSPQNFTISNTGKGTLNFSLSLSVPWLSVSQTSGTGSETVIVSVNTVGLSAGTHSGQITTIDGGATNSPVNTLVTLVLTKNQGKVPPLQQLRSAKITFIIPEGDDKDDNTKVSMTVTTRVNNQFEQTLASLDNFGDQQVWEDDGNHSYSYDLNIAGGVTYEMVTAGGIKTKIEWKPVGNDRGFFHYRLVLRFDDGDPSTAPIELEQTSPVLIEMSEGIRIYTNP